MSSHTAMRTRLLICPAHVRNESLRGYVSRVSSRNGSSPLLTPLLESLQATTVAIQEIATLTGCCDSLLKAHGSHARSRIKGHSGVMFGGGILSTAQVWLRRRMVCPICLTKNGVSTCCWELREYDVCHEHGCYLAGRCSGCDRPLHWISTSSETCSCGFRLADIKTEMASINRRSLCKLIADAMSATLTRPDQGEIVSGALTPLNWFFILGNFIRSILIPGFCQEHLESRSSLGNQTCEELLLVILKDREYCRHLRQVIFLHAAGNPMTMAQALRSGNSDQEMSEFFLPCFKDVIIHDRLMEIKAKRRKWRGLALKESPKGLCRPDEHRPESHSFQLQSAAFLSAVIFAFSDKR